MIGLKRIESPSGTRAGVFIATERLYLTADRSAAVKEGDVKAAFLLVPAGGELREADAKRFGLLKEEVEPPVELPAPGRESRVIRQSNKR